MSLKHGMQAPSAQGEWGERVGVGMRSAGVVALVALSAVVGQGWAQRASAQSMMDQMILSQCSAAMNADYQKAGKTPPEGLVQKTCECVVKKISETHNIDYAKKICTQKATQP